MSEDLSCKIAGFISDNQNDEYFFDQNKYFNKRLKKK